MTFVFKVLLKVLAFASTRLIRESVERAEGCLLGKLRSENLGEKTEKKKTFQK